MAVLTAHYVKHVGGGGVCVCQIPIHTLITYSNHTVTLQTHVSLLDPLLCLYYSLLYPIYT